MTFPKLESDRFTVETGLRVVVQVPEQDAQRLVDAVREQDALAYGDYDAVHFRTAPGSQQFRSLGGGRNAATGSVDSVPCIEVSFFIGDDEANALAVLTAIYWAHPYEEPVIFVTRCLRTRHVRGLDENNPNRFWNRPPADWVPEAHRPTSA